MTVNKAIVLICLLFFLVGCAPNEFSCEDNGGLWIDESCIKGTSDSFLACEDNSQCEGYCYTVKHPKALAENQEVGFVPSGSCSSHELPITCAKTIENEQIVELCR